LFTAVIVVLLFTGCYSRQLASVNTKIHFNARVTVFRSNPLWRPIQNFKTGKQQRCRREIPETATVLFHKRCANEMKQINFCSGRKLGNIWSKNRRHLVQNWATFDSKIGNISFKNRQHLVY